jgi:hypothetical protein
VPRVSRQLPSLFNGVSQQPAALRLPSQHEELTNVYSTVVDGIRKRPGLQHVTKVTDDLLSSDSAFIHNVDRDSDEQYIVVIADSEIRVFDLAGDEKTVNYPIGDTWTASTAYSLGQVVKRTDHPTAAGMIFRCTVAGTSKSGGQPSWNDDDVGDTTTDNTVTWEAVNDYLHATNPASGFAVVTVADYSFIVNRSVLVQTKAVPSAIPFYFNDWATSILDASTADAENFYVVEQDSLVGTVQTFAELPDTPSQGDIYRVRGNDAANFGTFYVVQNGGVWEETFKPGESVAYDEFTMPWALVRQSDGTFDFTQFPGKVRRVGGDDGNPPASFAGKRISDVFFWKNRLGFLSDESYICSGAGDYAQFWLQSMTDLVDSDYVDVAVSGKKVTKLRYAVPMAGRLLLFGDDAQFAVSTDQLLTPTSSSADEVTSYSSQPDVRPVGVGSDAYFPTPNGQHSRLREYYVRDEGENSTEAADITAHVPKYLPQHILQLSGNANEDVIFAITDTSGLENEIYVYKFFFNEEDRVQSAWQKWVLNANDKVLSVTNIENAVYFLIERDNGNDSGIYLEKVDLEEGAVTGALTFEVLLDRQAEATGAYQGAGPDTTRFTLDYPVPSNNRDDFKIVKGNDFTSAKGQLIDPDTYDWQDETTVDVPGDQSAGECHYGFNYTMTWELSEQFPEGRDGGNRTGGRLQLHSITLAFADTAFFETRVDPYGDGLLSQEESIVPASLSAFTGKTLGEASLTIGEPSFVSGTYRFQPYCNSRKGRIFISNPTHVQSKFLTMEWSGLYNPNARPG